jgi:[CysO sulfur-carrier protein]-S-L-cysteine hydrolase
VILTPEESRRIQAQAVEEYPAESCGVILSRGGERRLLRCRNQQDELHARDPQKHPRTSRTAYYIHSEDLLRICELQEEGFVLEVIYHSHVDTGAYFSPTDRSNATPGGVPMYPDAAYVVTAVVERRIDGMAAFRWSAEVKDFVEIELGVQATVGETPAENSR